MFNSNSAYICLFFAVLAIPDRCGILISVANPSLHDDPSIAPEIELIPELGGHRPTRDLALGTLDLRAIYVSAGVVKHAEVNALVILDSRHLAGGGVLCTSPARGTFADLVKLIRPSLSGIRFKCVVVRKNSIVSIPFHSGDLAALEVIDAASGDVLVLLDYS